MSTNVKSLVVAFNSGFLSALNRKYDNAYRGLALKAEVGTHASAEELDNFAVTNIHVSAAEFLSERAMETDFDAIAIETYFDELMSGLDSAEVEFINIVEYYVKSLRVSIVS